MKKYLFVIARYTGEKDEFFQQYVSPRNKEYCRFHGFEYVEIGNNYPLTLFRGNPTWWKFTIARDFILNGTIQEGDILTHLDADMCICKLDIPLITARSFAYSIDSGNTHCMGAYSMRINEWSKTLLDLILDEKRFAALNDLPSLHEAFNIHTCFWHEFREQASWYSLAGIKRHSWVPFWNLPHYGWRSNVDDWTVYSLRDLYENVEVLSTAWNVTELAGESSCQFDINKTPRHEVIIRHFAGGQPWRKEWFAQ